MVLATSAELTTPPIAPARRRLPAGRLAVGLAALGIGYRLVLLLAEVPPTNSDEAVTGLVARHVVQGNEFPLFFYGQYYMGALESYLAAPLFAAFDSSILALRLPNLLLYAAFLALMWQLTRRLYTPWLAAATVGLLALGSDRILKNQLIAGGGYPEMNPAGALLVLLAVNLGLGVVRRRALAYAGFGLVAGLTLWDDWLVLPYVAAAGVLLLGIGWRDLPGRRGLALLAGLLAGLVPIGWHNLTTAPENRSLAIYDVLNGEVLTSWYDRLSGGILFGVPMGTGLCPPERCASWQLWWGLAYPVLLVAAALLAAWALCRATGRPERVRQAGRLTLLTGAGLTLFGYVSSSAAALTPVESARYLSCLLISTPALLWPLWSMVTRRPVPGRPPVPGGSGAPARTPVAGRPGGGRLLRLAGAVPLTALVATMALASGSLIGASPALAREAAQRRDLVDGLDRLGVRRFYAEYWTCNNVIFLTRERLVCGVIRDDLQAGWDRYPAYPELVAEAPRPAFVLPAGTALNTAVRNHLRGTGVAVTETTVAGYDVYQTAAPVDLPLR
ncbi:hypothetical protein [Plantactinospora soyae]|uniref:Glycosyltransferase RgtA/B/C/D-like domain-containing protein n=1 Tax=Plantactinospora soyae TaxID=1544732 RepID=A0A927QZK0_9ACTN|nr:hypothetical protein [Plantactinospora soyae]MBE1487678.1 hypothetical protein [Plantactinospora soyae]